MPHTACLPAAPTMTRSCRLFTSSLFTIDCPRPYCLPHPVLPFVPPAAPTTTRSCRCSPPPSSWPVSSPPSLPVTSPATLAARWVVGVGAAVVVAECTGRSSCCSRLHITRHLAAWWGRGWGRGGRKGKQRHPLFTGCHSALFVSAQQLPAHAILQPHPPTHAATLPAAASACAPLFPSPRHPCCNAAAAALLCR